MNEFLKGSRAKKIAFEKSQKTDYILTIGRRSNSKRSIKISLCRCFYNQK